MRKGNVERNTKETKISCSIILDGTGKSNISTGIGFFDHMLELFVHHSLIDMDLKTEGDTNVDLVYFNARHPMLRQMLPTNENRLISGKLEYFRNSFQITHLLM